MNNIFAPEVGFSGRQLTGDRINKTVRKIGDLHSIFSDARLMKKPLRKIVYEVESYLPVKEGTTGGLFFGITHLHPGKVGDEYFMTKGHFHKIADRAEFYWGIAGEGMLILMDKHRKTWAEKMYPGSLHYIHGYTAHRTANTGNRRFYLLAPAGLRTQVTITIPSANAVSQKYWYSKTGNRC